MNTTPHPLLKLVRLCTLGFLAVWLVQIALFSLQWRISTDQPLMFYLGYLMDRFGAMPYRDVFEMNAPGTPLAYAWLGRATRFDDLLIRWADLLILFLLARAAYDWMRPFGRSAAGLGVICFVFIYFGGGPYMSLQREYLLLVPIAIAVLAATEGGGRASSPVPFSLAWRAGAAGICFGLAATIKPHAAIGLLPVLWYLYAASSGEGRYESRWGKLKAKFRTGGLLVGAAGVGFAIPPALVALWLCRNGALHPFLEITRRYWPLYQDLTTGLQVLPAEERSAYFNYYMRGLDGHSPWMIMALAGAYTGLMHTEAGSECRRRLVLVLQLAACYAIYVALGGKFWHYHFLPLFFFTSLLGGLCFMDLPATAAPREGWFLACTVLLGLFLSVSLPGEYNIQLQGFPPPAPKSGRADAIGQYLSANMKPGDTVQPLDVTGGAVHGMLIAGARLATPFLYDFHFYHHIYGDYTHTLRQRFIDAMVRARPRFVIRIETDKPWVSGEDTTTTFAELSDLLRVDYTVDLQGAGYEILKRKSPAPDDAATTRILVRKLERPKPQIASKGNTEFRIQNPE